MMANYYEKLTKIFLMSGNALFHAAAWSKYYAIVTSIGGKSEEEMSRLAGQVLISALAVPVGLGKDEPEELKGKNARLTALLGLNKMPSRQALLKDALARDVLKLSPEVVKQLYTVLEVNFEPLTLCASTAELFKVLSTDESLSSYLPLLQRALFSRLLSQLSQVYSTIKISNLLSLATPLKDSGIEGAYGEEQVEAYIMGCARRGELAIRVDHKDGSITFADDAYGPSEEPVASTSASVEQTIQPSVAELVRTRLSKVAVSLHSSLEKIEGSSKAPALTPEEQQAKFKTLVSAVEAERKALQIRRALVARRRELLSELSVRKEKEESSRRAEQNRKAQELEAIRAKEELMRKEAESAKKEIENIRIDEAKKYAQTLVDKGILKATEVDVSTILRSDLIERLTDLFPRNSKTSTRKASSPSKLLSSKRRSAISTRSSASSPSALTTLSVHTGKRSVPSSPRTTSNSKSPTAKPSTPCRRRTRRPLSRCTRRTSRPRSAC